MTQIQTDKVILKKNLYPIIINFQNGHLIENSLNYGGVLLNDPKNNTKTVATAIDNVVYAGEENTEELCKTFILARNKKTGKARLIESSIADLKPILKMNTVSQLVDTSNLELSRKFGSKKLKQKMEHHEKLKVNVETVTEQMQNATMAIPKDQVDLSTYNKSNSDDFYIPTIDRDATTAEEVYNIDNILTEDQYNMIYSELDGKDYIPDILSITKNILSKKQLPPKFVTLTLYADCLLQLSQKVMKDISKKSFTICPHSVTLNEIVLTEFLSTSSGKRTRPAPYKDKAICHAIVFLLLVNNLKIELDSLCEVLKLTAATASTKVKVTGASVVNTGNKKIVQLKLPLNTKSSFRRKKT